MELFSVFIERPLYGFQGVPKDFTTEATLRACLGEIDRCYQDNVNPFFINMTRYSDIPDTPYLLSYPCETAHY